MKLNKLIDHTLLNPFSLDDAIAALCNEAKKFDFYSVCVSPYFAKYCNKILKDSDVQVSTVIGFPYGYESTSAKIAAMQYVIDYVDEFDIVVNLPAVSNSNWPLIKNEMEAISSFARSRSKITKWIVESGNMEQSSLITLCKIFNEVQPDFMKTSTGVLGPGASIEAITLMREQLNKQIHIKASGGIRDRATAIGMIHAGASRIGASKSVEIVTSPQ